MAESTSSSGKKDIVPINMRDSFSKDPFFSSTWDEFDQMRSDMMSRSKDFWSKVDEDFANFDDTVRKSHDDMDRQMEPFQPQLPRWAIPDDLRTKWNPITRQDSQNEVSTYLYKYIPTAYFCNLYITHWAYLEKSDPLDFQEMHRMKKLASSFRPQIVHFNQ